MRRRKWTRVVAQTRGGGRVLHVEVQLGWTAWVVREQWRDGGRKNGYVTRGRCCWRMPLSDPGTAPPMRTTYAAGWSKSAVWSSATPSTPWSSLERGNGRPLSSCAASGRLEGTVPANTTAQNRADVEGRQDIGIAAGSAAYTVRRVAAGESSGGTWWRGGLDECQNSCGSLLMQRGHEVRGSTGGMCLWSKCRNTRRLRVIWEGVVAGSVQEAGFRRLGDGRLAGLSSVRWSLMVTAYLSRALSRASCSPRPPRPSAAAQIRSGA